MKIGQHNGAVVSTARRSMEFPHACMCFLWVPQLPNTANVSVNGCLFLCRRNLSRVHPVWDWSGTGSRITSNPIPYGQFQQISFHMLLDVHSVCALKNLVFGHSPGYVNGLNKESGLN